jgi:predicted nucleic acid-binding protein
LTSIDAELRAQTIVPKPDAPSALAVRDPDDAWVLASAVAGAADMLVTGDLDLLSIATAAPLPIVDPRGCWARLRGDV